MMDVQEMAQPTPQPQRPPAIPTVSLVIWQVAAWYGIGVDDILGHDRSREYARPRQVAMYLASRLCNRSSVVIAREFGRHHTTVLHGVNTILGEIERNENYLPAVVAWLEWEIRRLCREAPADQPPRPRRLERKVTL